MIRQCGISCVVKKKQTSKVSDSHLYLFKRSCNQLQQSLERKRKMTGFINTRHACVFCEKLYPNISKHLLGKTHENEHEIIRIKKLNPNADDDDNLEKQYTDDSTKSTILTSKLPDLNILKTVYYTCFKYILLV